jgi:putative hemolysin
MLLPAVLLFAFFLLLGAFFSAAETAFVAVNPLSLEALEKRGSKRAASIKRLLGRMEHLLTGILIGNTLVNISAASLSTFVFVILIPNERTAVLLSMVCTTVLVLFISEINPKVYAASHPLRLAYWFVYPIRFFIALFFPFIHAFNFISRLLFPSSRTQTFEVNRLLNEEETRILLASRVKGLSTLRKKMITEILDIGLRPIKQIMIPRPLIKAVDIDASLTQILEFIRTEGISRFPVYRGRLDNLEGLVHAKDIIPYILDNKEFNLRLVVRKPLFVPESASLEKVLLQMQENAVHLAFIVDEFGNMEGIVTLEDILEEIVGDIRDEHDKEIEAWQTKVADNTFLLKGQASIKDINDRLDLGLPEKKDYATLAGFLLSRLERIPHEKDVLSFGGHSFTIEKMNKRHISLVRIQRGSPTGQPPHENRRHQ